MPASIIISGGKSPETTAAQRTDTFTGQVWSQLVHSSAPPSDQPQNTTTPLGMAAGNNVFMPCSRTYWHTHEGGQLLHVTVGAGWICDRGGEPQRIKAGDTIWAEPGTTHWHGADKNSFMSHLAVGLGKTTWHEEVADDLYK